MFPDTKNFQSIRGNPRVLNTLRYDLSVCTTKSREANNIVLKDAAFLRSIISNFKGTVFFRKLVEVPGI